MKVGITGHTKGIGKSIFDYFSKHHDVIGFSRSNGFDISTETARLSISETIKDFDIFVNNAYQNYNNSQLLLLQSVYKQWIDTDKIIINISSRYTNDDHAYAQTKNDLNNFCKNTVYNKLYVMNICPGLVDTDRVKTISDKKMSTGEILTVIDFALNNIDRFKIHNITFGL